MTGEGGVRNIPYVRDVINESYIILNSLNRDPVGSKKFGLEAN